MTTRFAPVNQKKNLAKALKPYADSWNEWIKSPSCFLSIQEIQLIEIYQQTGSYAACRDHLHIGIIEAANELIKIILRLKVSVNKFQQWKNGNISLYEVLSYANVKSLDDLKSYSWDEIKKVHEKNLYTPYEQRKVSSKPP